jgi:hypothetical protein
MFLKIKIKVHTLVFISSWKQLELINKIHSIWNRIEIWNGLSDFVVDLLKLMMFEGLLN